MDNKDIQKYLDEIEDKLKLEPSGILSGGIKDKDLWDLPIGDVVVGGFAAIFASELVDRILRPPRIVRALDRIMKVIPGIRKAWARYYQKYTSRRAFAKLGVAAAISSNKSDIWGAGGSKTLALLLTFDAMKDLGLPDPDKLEGDNAGESKNTEKER